MTPAGTFEQAVALQQAGRLAEALAEYERVLAQAPHFARAHYHRGLVLHALGRYREAVEGYDRAVAFQPDYADALVNRGVALAAQRRYEEALASYDRALALNCDLAELHNNRGLVLRMLDRLPEALRSYERALGVRPDYARAWCNHGDVLQELRRTDEALASYDRALRHCPDFAEAYNSRGNALHGAGRLAEALASYDQAVRLKPDYADAWSNRGNVLRDLRRCDEALASCDRALAVNPAHAEAHNNRGAALRDLDRPVEALACFERALANRPTFAAAHNNLGGVLSGLRRPQEALACFERAVALKPDYANAHWHLSLCHLLLGDYARGWAEYEWRWRKSEAEERRPYGQPVWLGREDIRGRTVLLTAEQGLGDTLQFCRYATAVVARGARVVLEVQAPLQRVLGRLAGVSAVVARGEAPPAFDYQCPLMSLPLACGTTAEERIPAAIPYLGADADAIRTWRERLGPRTGARVGIAWSGFAGFRNDSNRSMPLQALLPLRESGVRLISLQKEVRERDRATLEAHPEIEPWGETLTDFADTAGLIEHLDLVISVDTAVAHLAGALGKPVWVLLPYAPDWRWQLDRTDSPWYPTARLYRQPAAGDWDSVVVAVAAALRVSIKRMAPV